MSEENNLLKQANQILRARYAVIAPLIGGGLNDTFLLQGEQRAIVLSLLPATRSLQQLNFQKSVLRQLRQLQAPVIRIHERKDVDPSLVSQVQTMRFQEKDRPYLFTECSEGEIRDHWKYAEFTLLQETLSSFSIQARRIKTPFAPVRQMHRSAQTLRSLSRRFRHRKAVLRSALNSLADWEQSLLLPFGLVHGDLSPKNILLSDPGLSNSSPRATIIDFDNAHVSWSLLDPVYMALQAASSTSGNSSERVFQRSKYEAFIKPLRSRWSSSERENEEGMLVMASLLALVHAHEVGTEQGKLFELFIQHWQSFFEQSSFGRGALDCKSAPKCGGCPLFSLSAQEEKEVKLKKVKALLKPLSSHLVLSYDSSPAHLGYRNRIRLRVDEGIIQFFNPDKSHDCAVLEPNLAALVKRVLRKTRGHKKFYTQFRHLELRAADLDGKLAIHWSLCRCPDRFSEIMDYLHGLFPDLLHAVTFFDPAKKQSIRISEDHSFTVQRFAAGTAYQYIPITEFVQINHDTNQRLIDQVLRLGSLLKLNQGKVFDLFGGAGNYALPISQRFPELDVLSIEWTPLAARSLTQAAKEQQLNVKALTADVHQWLLNESTSDDSEVTDSPELVIVNPPRRGLCEGCLPLTRLRPKAILEIACKPESLKRDLDIFLSEGYHLVSVQVFNMFPHTAHIESLALLVRDQELATELSFFQNRPNNWLEESSSISG